MSPIPGNRRLLPRVASGARAAKFSFSKYHRDLKMNFFYFICKDLLFYFIEQSPIFLVSLQILLVNQLRIADFRVTGKIF